MPRSVREESHQWQSIRVVLLWKFRHRGLRSLLHLNSRRIYICSIDTMKSWFIARRGAEEFSRILKISLHGKCICCTLGMIQFSKWTATCHRWEIYCRHRSTGAGNWWLSLSWEIRVERNNGLGTFSRDSERHREWIIDQHHFWDPYGSPFHYRNIYKYIRRGLP